MQVQFICHKPIFVNFELRHKLIKRIDKTFSKKKKQVDQFNPTQG